MNTDVGPIIRLLSTDFKEEMWDNTVCLELQNGNAEASRGG